MLFNCTNGTKLRKASRTIVQIQPNWQIFNIIYVVQYCSLIQFAYSHQTIVQGSQHIR